MDSNKIIVDSSEFPHPAEKHKRSFKIFGIIQLVAGLVVLAIGIYGGASAFSLTYVEPIDYTPPVSDYLPNGSYGGDYAISLDDELYVADSRNDRMRYCMLAVGIVSGLFFIVSGSFGLASGQKPTNCNVIAGLVMTVFSAIFAVIFVLYQVAAVLYYPEHYPKATLDGLQYTALFTGMLIFIVAIVHSAFSCATTCCAKPVKKVILLTKSPPEYDYNDSMKKKLIEV